VAIERSEVRLAEGPLRMVGDHEIEIHLHTEVSVPITVTVEAEE
jgi:large subunit ribosomal protein L9